MSKSKCDTARDVVHVGIRVGVLFWFAGLVVGIPPRQMARDLWPVISSPVVMGRRVTRELGRCPVEGCPNTRQTGHLACRTCWRRVSKPTQDLVYKTWRKVKGLAGSDEDWQAYDDARKQAIREAEA